VGGDSSHVTAWVVAGSSFQVKTTLSGRGVGACAISSGYFSIEEFGCDRRVIEKKKVKK
jgi:hypothetical protein